MLDLFIGAVFGIGCAFFMAITPNSSVLHLVAMGSWLGGNAAASSWIIGYITYQALTSYREAYRPEMSGDQYHQTTVNIFEQVLPTPAQLSLIINAKSIGLSLGLFLSLVFWIIDFNQVTMLGLTYTILGVIILGSLGQDKKLKDLPFLFIYLGIIALSFKLLDWCQIVNPVIVIGLSFFAIPPILLGVLGLQKPEIIIPLKCSKMNIDPEIVKEATLPITTSCVLSCMTPGMSSSALGSWFYKSNEGRMAVYGTEVCTEVLGITFGILGLDYGSSYLNLEINSLELLFEPSVFLLLPIGAAVWSLGCRCVSSSFFVQLCESTMNSRVRNASLGISILLLVLAAGWVAIPFLVLGTLVEWFLYDLDCPPGFKSLTFLGAMIFP